MLPEKKDSAPIICWLFCTVIDNYGDIGVTWRLARELHRRLGWQIHLWLDDAAALRAISPDLPPLPCTHHHIRLHAWQTQQHASDIAHTPPPHVVIETFACTLPNNALAAARAAQPVWLNWEYLSAENWAEKLHATASLLPDGSRKYFWLMGFGAHSGGLLREAGYTAQARTAAAPQARTALRRQLGLPEKNAPEWFVFGYVSPVWAEWLAMWQAAGTPLTLLLAGTQIADSLRSAQVVPDHALRHSGDTWQAGNVRLVRIPFVPQAQFDALLQLADGLIVRGEDSFIRAQYAAKPFFWHIYPQEEHAHIDKLHAFWYKTATCYDADIYRAQQLLSDELNGAVRLLPAQRLAAWQTLQQGFDVWQQNAAAWQQQLFAQNDAVSRFDEFLHTLAR